MRESFPITFFKTTGIGYKTTSNHCYVDYPTTWSVLALANIVNGYDGHCHGHADWP